MDSGTICSAGSNSRGVVTLLPPVSSTHITHCGHPYLARRLAWVAAAGGERVLVFLATDRIQPVTLVLAAGGACLIFAPICGTTVCAAGDSWQAAALTPAICRVCMPLPNSLCCAHLTSCAGLSVHMVDQVGRHCRVNRCRTLLDTAAGLTVQRRSSTCGFV